MSRYLLMMVFAVCAEVCAGQSPWKVRSDNYLGVTAGEIGGAMHVQTVNGVYKRPWFFGVGAGLDYYRFRSVPLFVSVKRDLLSFGNNSVLSLYLDGGINLPWYKRQLTFYQQEFVTSSTFRAGVWGSAGMGYEWRLSAHSRKALLFSAGYSMKKLTEKLAGVHSPCTGGVACPLILPQQQTYIYEYLNHTFLFLAGFRF